MGRLLRTPALLLALLFFLSGCGGHAVTSSAAVTTASVQSSTTTSDAPTAVPTAVPTAAPTATAVPPTATPPPATATPVAIVPVKLQIPSIGVDTKIEQVGLTSDGAMENPSSWGTVGWYKYGPPPGQPGNAVIDGHLDSTTGPAVFWHLSDLKPGDKIVVTLSNGQTATFAVSQKIDYPYNNAPISKIFGPGSAPNLNLITCGGDWNPATKNYSDRLVVFATKA